METIKNILKITLLIPLILINSFSEYRKLAEVKNVPYSYIKWIVCIILLPSIIPLYIFSVLLRQLLSIVLFFKYKSKFGGILKDQDGALNVDYPEHVLIDIIFLIESDKSPQDFYEMVKKHINEVLKSKLAINPKICGTLNMFFGYPYMLRDEVTIDECITKLKRAPGDTISKEDLLKLNEEERSEPLPKDNKGFWRILIGTQPVDWDENSNKSDLKVYPIKLLLSHCVADGVHVGKAILALFGDKQNDIPKETTGKEGSLSNSGIFSQILYNLSHLLSYVSVFLVNSILVTSSPPDILHGKKLSRHKFMCVARDESSKYLQIAKNIKNRYSDVALSDVFATAFSASLTEYLQKHAIPIPKYLTCVVVEAPTAVNLLSATPSSMAKSKIVCKNNFGVYVPKLPTFVETEQDHINLKKMLRNSALQNKQIHKNGEPEAYRWLTNTFTPNVPTDLSRWFAACYDVHVMITNVPGFPLIKVMDGNLLKKIIFWGPHARFTGIGLAMNTYGGKLQMSLNVDSALVPEREQVQKILDDIFKYIDLLDEATRKEID